MKSSSSEIVCCPFVYGDGIRHRCRLVERCSIQNNAHTQRHTQTQTHGTKLYSHHPVIMSFACDVYPFRGLLCKLLFSVFPFSPPQQHPLALFPCDISESALTHCAKTATTWRNAPELSGSMADAKDRTRCTWSWSRPTDTSLSWSASTPLPPARSRRCFPARASLPRMRRTRSTLEKYRKRAPVPPTSTYFYYVIFSATFPSSLLFPRAWKAL